MEKLTVIIPTLNEAHNIGSLLEQIDFANEIIVIDSYSSDDTEAIAKTFKTKIIQRKFDNFSNQKNYAIDAAKNSWIFLIDADERVPEKLKEEVLSIINSDTKIDGFWIYRTNFFMERRLRFSGIQNDKVLRLFRKESCRYNGKLVHEEIETKGTTAFLKNRFDHYSFHNFASYKNKLDKYARLQSVEYEQKVKHVTPYHLIIKPAFRFFKHYIIGLGILDGYPGLKYAYWQMHTVYLRYAYVKQLKKSNSLQSN